MQCFVRPSQRTALMLMSELSREQCTIELWSAWEVWRALKKLEYRLGQLQLRYVEILPNDGNISTQHPNTTHHNIVGPVFGSPGQTIASYRNTVGRNKSDKLRAFGHPAVTCCGMLRVENRTSAHAPAQHCCTNLTKRLQHHAKSTNVASKIWPFSSKY